MIHPTSLVRLPPEVLPELQLETLALACDTNTQWFSEPPSHPFEWPCLRVESRPWLAKISTVTEIFATYNTLYEWLINRCLPPCRPSHWLLSVSKLWCPNTLRSTLNEVLNPGFNSSIDPTVVVSSINVVRRSPRLVIDKHNATKIVNVD